MPPSTASVAPVTKEPSSLARKTIARATSSGLACLASGIAYWHRPPDPAPQAIIVGYATPATPASHAYRPALNALSQVLTQG